MSTHEMILQGFLPLYNWRHSSWSVFRPDRIQTGLRREAKRVLYLHVFYQDLYHAGPGNRQLTASVQCGKQTSQCQGASQSARCRGKQEEEKTKQKTEVISLASAESFPLPHTWGLHCFSSSPAYEFSCSAEVPDSRNAHRTGKSERGRKTLALFLVSAEENQVDTCHRR